VPVVSLTGQGKKDAILNSDQLSAIYQDILYLSFTQLVVQAFPFNDFKDLGDFV
jgi:hypothetical protein